MALLLEAAALGVEPDALPDALMGLFIATGRYPAAAEAVGRT